MCNTFTNLFIWPGIYAILGILAGVGLTFCYYQDTFVAMAMAMKNEQNKSMLQEQEEKEKQE